MFVTIIDSIQSNEPLISKIDQLVSLPASVIPAHHDDSAD